MSRWLTWLYLIVFVFTVACSRAPEGGGENAAGAATDAESSTGKSADDQPWSGSSLNQWTLVFAEMQEVLDLSAEEKQSLETTFEQHVQEIQSWYQKHGQTIANGDRDAIQAARDRDVGKLRKIKDEVVPLKQEATALHKAMDTAVLNALTEPNRFGWQGHRLAARFLELAESLELSDEQRAQIQNLAVQAAQRVGDHDNPQAAGFLELEKRTEAQVLDASQRASYQEIKDKHKLRSLKTYSSFQPTRNHGSQGG